MDFESALEYLDGFFSYENVSGKDYKVGDFDLDRVKNFLKAWKIDYSKMKFIHVGGSKGKGTVTRMLAEYLWASGFKVGLFSSPHILSFRERFWLNGEEIGEQKIASVVADLRGFLNGYSGEVLTHYEILTVLALKIFCQENVDYTILEVGLGGSLDATNVVNPKLVALTKIELEHQDILGETLGEIINEKLGIVKDGASVVVGYQSEEAEDILRNRLAGREKTYFLADLEDLMDLGGDDEARCANGKQVYAIIRLLLGRVNDVLFEKVFINFSLVGRFDVRNIDGKIVVFDMAHTISSIANLLKALDRKFPDRDCVFLLSIMEGKAAKEIVGMIANKAKAIMFSKSHKNRSLNPLVLAEYAQGEIVDDPKIAYKRALEGLKAQEILVVTGSHFLLKQVF